MQLNYLCPKHADWVYNNPKHAVHILHRDELQGVMLFYEEYYSESIPYLGCAFDILAILLELAEGDTTELIEKVESISSLLAQAYNALDKNEYQIAIAQRAEKLVHAVTSLAVATSIKKHINQI